MIIKKYYDKIYIIFNNNKIMNKNIIIFSWFFIGYIIIYLIYRLIKKLEINEKINDTYNKLVVKKIKEDEYIKSIIDKSIIIKENKDKIKNIKKWKIIYVGNFFWYFINPLIYTIFIIIWWFIIYDIHKINWIIIYWILIGIFYIPYITYWQNKYFFENLEIEIKN